jgi:hypothetical protein
VKRFTRWDPDHDTYYKTYGTRFDDRSQTLRGEVYAAIGFMLVVAALLVLWGGLSR